MVPPEPTRPPQPGDIVGGRYLLGAQQGSGAYATVFRGRDTLLDRAVAIKVLLHHGRADQAGQSEKFLREARMAAAVQHPNVVQTLDFGSEAGRPFMVMELVQGRRLTELLESPQGVSVQATMQIGQQVLEGLAAIHAAGSGHRDMKPDNVLLVDGAGSVRARIVDFGVSRAVGAGRRSAYTTQEGMILGTPEYMSPEQARGLADIDARSDVYNVGVMLYEALSGNVPYTADTVADMIARIVAGGAKPLAALRPDLEPGLCAVVDQAMARDPATRFADASAMLNALRSVAGRGDPQVSAAEPVAVAPRAPSARINPHAPTQPSLQGPGRDQLRPPPVPASALAAQLPTLDGTALPAQRQPRAAQAVPVPAEAPPATGDGSHSRASWVESGRAPQRSAAPPAFELDAGGAPAQGTGLELAVAPVRTTRHEAAGGPEAWQGRGVGVAVPGRAKPKRYGVPWLLVLAVVAGAAFLYQGGVGRGWIQQWVALAGERAAEAAPEGAQAVKELLGPSTVRIQLVGVPDNAYIRLDGVPSATDTFELPRDGALHLLEVGAKGRAQWSRSFEARQDQTYHVVLAEE